MLNCIFKDTIFLSSFLAVSLICMTTALWGTILLVERRPLLSESLSHACYPGLLIGALVSHKVSWFADSLWVVIFFGCLAAILGCLGISFLEKRLGMHKDSALCFILVSFFGIGVILVSYVKDCCPLLYNKINAYLYGQAATLGYVEARLALVIFCLSAVVLWWWYRQIAVAIFDREFAYSCGLRTRTAETVVLIFLSLVVVSGVRSVGILLISAMFVAPPLSARQLSDKLSTLLILSSIFGGICGALGCSFSVAFTCQSVVEGKATAIILPTGPLVVFFAGLLVFLCLIFSWKTGWVTRYIRRKWFLFSRDEEHLLKILWYLQEQNIFRVGMRDFVRSKRYQEYFGSKAFPGFRMFWLCKKGLVSCSEHQWALTDKGAAKAAKLVRAHRLWESYLVRELDFNKNKVHNFAEEMEHVLTDELDTKLSQILQDPDYDPHHREIPKRKGK